MKTEPNSLSIHEAGVQLPQLTKREYFASAALQGLAANGFNSQIIDQAEKECSTLSEAIAIYAVDLADELIKALNEQQS